MLFSRSTTKKFLSKKFFVLSLLTTTLFLAVPAGFSATTAGSNSLPPLQGRVVTIPAGSQLGATLQNTISSDFARVGDRVTATLGSDVYSGGVSVLPAGSQLEGQVVSVTPTGLAGRHGTLELRFTGAITPQGQRVPLSAKLQTEDNSGILKGGTTANRVGSVAARTAAGAGIGALGGVIGGAIMDKGAGKGAVAGTAIGGLLGAASSVASKGKAATLNAGQMVNIVLDQPLSNAPSPSYGYPNNYPNSYPRY